MVRRNTEQQFDTLIEPVRARVQQLESQMSADPRDPLTAEYTKAKNMLNAYETIRDNRLREIDKMYGMAYTENRTEPVNQNVHYSIDLNGETGKTGRSQAINDAISNLNAGKDIDLEAVMNTPEIAEAERSNEGTMTINLPGREGIRQAAYDRAMQIGSWNGTDYSGPVRQERRMDIVIGLPGSGKSSVYTNPLSQQHGSRVVDTDDYRGFIPEYNGTNAELVHEEASHIKDRVLDSALENGDNILLSTVGANADKLARQIAEYKSYGYSVYLHLNELSNSKAMARAINRYVSEDGTLGRYVSPRLIAEYGDKPTQTYLYLTGQGGNANGRLGENLRESGGRELGIPGETSERVLSEAESLSGYDWYNNDVEYGERPRLVQSSENQASEESGAFSMPESGERGGKIMEESVGAAVHDPNSYSALQGEYGTIEPGENPAREIDKMYGMAYTENQERRATWNEENRTKWREQYGGGEAETAAATVYGGRRAVPHLNVPDQGGLEQRNSARETKGTGFEVEKTYQETGGSRSLETQNGREYTFQAVSREGTTPKARSIADTLTSSGIRTYVYDGEVNTVDKTEKSIRVMRMQLL